MKIFKMVGKIILIVWLIITAICLIPGAICFGILILLESIFKVNTKIMKHRNVS